MRLHVRDIKRLIAEELAAQAPPDAPMGQWAWPNQRTLDVDEHDTHEEVELLDAIVKAILDTEKPLQLQQAELLFKCLKNGWYKEVIKEPDVDVVYRGIGVTGEKLESMLGGTITGETGTLKKSLSYTPIAAGSSWSKRAEVADEFARNVGYTKKPEYSVVFTASTAANRGKMIDFEEFYMLNYETDGNSPEKEVYALGSVMIEGIAWASRSAVRADINALIGLL